jgi:Tol biopolymer transport system component/serine/threonine protein kinase
MIGKRIAHYIILEKLGAGGMGVVYKAEDTTLGRLVALKFLPEELSQDPDILERFRREARLASSLNHPNICTIYEIGQQDGQFFIAMELLQGQTLSSLMVSKPLNVDQILEIGIQVTDALDAAHSAGIIHRDVKPANIFVTAKSQAKVLDFGLAVSTQQKHRIVAGPNDATMFEPLASHLTSPGTTIGTVAYMSPEQALGEDLDARTDLFSLGVVLYEMTTGVQPFKGATSAAVFNAIINQRPIPIARLNPAISPKLQELVEKALEKKCELRSQSAAEINADLKRLKREIESTALIQTAANATASRRRWSATWILVPLVALLVLGYLLRTQFSGNSSHPITAAKLAQLTTTEGLHEFPAWAPDGNRIAYCRDVNGFKKIFVKPLQGEPQQLTSGNTDDIQPRWTPDGQAILFVRSNQSNGKLEPGDVFGQYDGGDIWKKDISSGREERFLSNAFNPSFSPDGKSLAVDTSLAGPRRIWIVDAQGHNPQQITSDNSEAVAHLEPSWSPDGKYIVFQDLERTKFSVKVVDVATHALTALTDGRFHDLNPVWSRSGKFIYFSSDRGGGLNIWRIGVSATGQANSAPQQVTMGSGQDIQLAMSTSGKQLGFSILRQNADLWRLPVSPETGLATGNPEEVLASTREDSRGAWSPDSSKIAFNSDRSGEMNIYVHSLADRSIQQLTKGPGGDFQPQWSPDAKQLVFFSSRSGNADLWMLSMDTNSLKQLTSDPALDINPFFSPDGRSIAFQSDRSGRLEVWAMASDGSNQRQLSRTGVIGHFLRWSREGDMVYRCPCGGKSQVYRVPLNGGDPVPLNPEIAGGSHMSFSPDSSLIMDVVGHKTLSVSQVNSGKPVKVYEFPDSESRIDYPTWSPNGKWVLFDRFRPHGGDIWMIENFE